MTNPEILQDEKMNTIKITGKALEAVKFDGTFEAAVEITHLLKRSAGFERITRFQIEAELSGANAHLSFKANPPKNDPNLSIKEFSFRIGDYLIISGSSYDKFTGDFVRKYFDGWQ
jgi:hypothetical protein